MAKKKQKNVVPSEKNDRDTVIVISWGLAGVHWSYKKATISGLSYGNCSCTTHMNPEYFLPLFESGEYQAKDHNKNADFANSYVIDMEKVLEESPVFSVRAPMLDVHLAPRAINKGYKNTIENGQLSQAGSFDYVGIELYIEYWRNAGARIGKVQDDGKTIVWEEKIENQLSMF
jgi:hypothetical protein